MPNNEEHRDKHFSGSGSSEPGERIDPKKLRDHDGKPFRRSVPIGIPISVKEYKKLKDKAKTNP
jgi:hypothetical protein